QGRSSPPGATPRRYDRARDGAVGERAPRASRLPRCLAPQRGTIGGEEQVLEIELQLELTPIPALSVFGHALANAEELPGWSYGKSQDGRRRGHAEVGAEFLCGAIGAQTRDVEIRHGRLRLVGDTGSDQDPPVCL